MRSRRLATRNMANLHRVVRAPLRPGAAARIEADYEVLRRYHDRLGAEQGTSARFCVDAQGL